jgi:chromosome segregation ATPase|tara:strand:- start:5397 stop:5711 length:315 start_codon:yes stop_codon:yes gene_type:complete
VLRSDLNGKIEDIQKLKHEHEEAVTKCREYQYKNDQLTENMAVLTAQKADVDKQVAVLSQAMETVKAELKTAQDKVMFLTDENKVILQEKAVIQGRFKQLQESL